MEDGLFGSLYDNNKTKKYTANGPSGINYSSSMNFNSWDGSPLPLSQNLKDASIIPTSPSVGLPENKSLAPWDYQQPIRNENIQQQFDNQKQININYTNQNQQSNQGGYQDFRQQKQDIPPASMYSYADSKNVHMPDNGRFVDQYGQLKMSAYQHQSEQNQQIFKQDVFDNLYQQSLNNQIKNETNISGLDPFNEGSLSYGNTGINIQNPNDGVIIDRTANLKYINAGRHNVEPYSSQYGLCDVPHSEWVKATTISALPIINIIYLIYIGYVKSFIKYPMLKDWSRGNLINAALINIAWIISFFALLLT